MNRLLCLVSLVCLAATAGCYPFVGPFETQEGLQKNFDKVEPQMARAEVEDILGKPTKVISDTDQQGQVQPDSLAAWLVYNYDYAEDPMMIAIHIDHAGLVTEKHLERKSEIGLEKLRERQKEELSYPGAPQKRFQELEKERRTTGN